MTDATEFAALRRGLFHPKADLTMTPVASAPAAVGHLAAVGRHHFGWAPDRVEPLGQGGTFHALFRLSWADGRGVIARVNRLSDQRRDLPLLLDRWAAAALRAVGLPALEVYAVDLSRRLCPFDYELMEPAPGMSMLAYDEDDDALRPLLVRLGAFAARLHGVGVEGYGLLEIDEGGERAHGGCAGWAAYLGNHLDRHVAVCRAAGAVSAAEADTIARLLHEGIAALPAVRPALLHGDLGMPNVFVAGGEVSAVIDWEDALAGDPAYDVACWATFHPERRHAAFFEGYFGGRHPEDDFMDRFWLYFLRAALAKTVVRCNLGLVDKPGRQPSALRLQRGLRGVLEARRRAA